MDYWTVVSREEWERFVKSYPRRLTSNLTGVCEPPQRTYYDYTLPSNESAVASVSLREAYSEPNEYRIHRVGCRQ
jgi:hypothetical protein